MPRTKTPKRTGTRRTLTTTPQGTNRLERPQSFEYIDHRARVNISHISNDTANRVKKSVKAVKAKERRNGRG